MQPLVKLANLHCRHLRYGLAVYLEICRFLVEPCSAADRADYLLIDVSDHSRIGNHL